MNQENTNQKDFLILSEAADYMRCSVDSLRADVANRRIPFIPRPDGPLFLKAHLREFLLTAEIEPDVEIPPKPGEANIETKLLKRLVERSGLVPDYKDKYINLRARKGGRVIAQLHQNPSGVHLAIPEASDDETVPQSPLEPADIEHLGGYSIGPEKSWLRGDGNRGTYKKAIAFNIPDSIGNDSDAWTSITALIEYAKKRTR